MRRGFLKGQQRSQVQAQASVYKLSLKNDTLVADIWPGQILHAAPDPKPARVGGKCAASFSGCWIRALNMQPGRKTPKQCAAARCGVEEGLVRAGTAQPFAMKTRGCTGGNGPRENEVVMRWKLQLRKIRRGRSCSCYWCNYSLRG